MTRECLTCFAGLPLTNGLMCSQDKEFLCKECVKGQMEADLNNGEMWRPDGALMCGESVFELYRLQQVASVELLQQWQKAQWQAKEKQVLRQMSVTSELQRLAREKLPRAERFAREMAENVIPFSCPACHDKLEYDKGCMAMKHEEKKGGCGASFCIYCEGVFKDAHSHVLDCTANTLELPWLPPGDEAMATFALVQRERQVRQLRVRFAATEQTLREQVFVLLQEELRKLDIAKQDVMVEEPDYG